MDYMTEIVRIVSVNVVTKHMKWTARGEDAEAGFDEGVAAFKRGDYATALREWRPLAEQGDADTQFNLALMYRKGEGVPQDYSTHRATSSAS